MIVYLILATKKSKTTLYTIPAEETQMFWNEGARFIFFSAIVPSKKIIIIRYGVSV